MSRWLWEGALFAGLLEGALFAAACVFTCFRSAIIRCIVDHRCCWRLLLVRIGHAERKQARKNQVRKILYLFLSVSVSVSLYLSLSLLRRFFVLSSDGGGAKK